MLVAEALTRIKTQFGDEYGVMITDPEIYGWMYQAELDIIRSAGSNDVTISVAASSFPNNIPDSVNVKRISVEGTALQYTTKDELDLLGLSDTLTSGGLSYWFKENKQIHLWPQQPGNAQLIKITYSKTPVLIVTGVPTTFTVPEVYHTDIITYCIAKAHNKNNNSAAEKIQMDMYDRNIGVRRDENNSIDAPIYKGNDPMDYNDYGAVWL